MKNLSRNEWDLDIIAKNKVIINMNEYQNEYISLGGDPKINRFMLISYANDYAKESKMKDITKYRLVKELYNAKSMKSAIRIFNYNFKDIKLNVNYV